MRPRSVSERQPTARRRPRAGHALALERRGDPLGRQRIEAHELAARDDRLEHAPERLGEEDEVHEGRRLLERLQQSVGDLVVHGLDALEHEHPPGRLERRARGGGHDRLVDVADAHDVRTGGADPGQVGMGSHEHAPVRVLAVGSALGQQLGGERGRRGALARAGRPVE